MAAITHGATHRFHLHTAALRTIVVLLTLGTAAIHASLGGMLFMANAAGYVVLAIAMVAPGPAARWRWLIRLALIAFAAATIGGWVAFGPRFGLAYLDKALEVALIGVLLDRAVAVGRRACRGHAPHPPAPRRVWRRHERPLTRATRRNRPERPALAAGRVGRRSDAEFVDRRVQVGRIAIHAKRARAEQLVLAVAT